MDDSVGRLRELSSQAEMEDGKRLAVKKALLKKDLIDVIGQEVNFTDSLFK